MRIRKYINWKPFKASLPYECEYGNTHDCTFFPHKEFENEDIRCFSPLFYDSVCPGSDKTPRPLNTYTIYISINENVPNFELGKYYVRFIIPDDDDWYIGMYKYTNRFEDFEDMYTWFNNIPYIDEIEICNRFSQLGFEYE